MTMNMKKNVLTLGLLACMMVGCQVKPQETTMGNECTDPKKLDGLLNMFIDTEFGIAPDSFRLILV